MAQQKYIKDMYEKEGLSLREISRRTGHCFETVQKYAYKEDWSEDELPNLEPENYPLLETYIPTINEWLVLHPACFESRTPLDFPVSSFTLKRGQY